MGEKQKHSGGDYDISLQWCVTNSCNFSCQQCIGKAVSLKSKYVPEKINVRDLKKFLSKLDKTALFTFSGGEPLFVKDIVKVFAEITKKHYIGLISNLTSEQAINLAEEIKPERVRFIKASAHILELERLKLFDQFLEHYKLLRDRGFYIEVAEVAYPHMTDKLGFYREKFKEHGINLAFQAFSGTWNGKKYPNEYTEEETKIFNFDSQQLQYKTDIFNQEGKFCNAGYNTAVIDSDGVFYPCYQIRESMGNMSEDVNFRSTLIQCPFKSCSCPLNIYEGVLMEKALQSVQKK